MHRGARRDPQAPVVAMLPQLAVAMPRRAVVAIVAARAAAARAAAARAVAAKIVAAKKIVAARAAAAKIVATPVVATKADAMPLPLAVAQSPPVDVALRVRPMPSRCPPRRSPMLPR